MKKTVITKKLFFCIEIFLILIFPSFVIGFDYFENTKLYNQLFHFQSIEEVLNTKFSIDIDKPQGSLISSEAEPKLFNDTWGLIKKYSPRITRNDKPSLIGRLGMENAPYVNWPDTSRKIFLIPESAPILIIFNCPDQKFLDRSCSSNYSIIAGTIGDFKNWYLEEQRWIKIKANLFLSILSIILGMLLLVKEQKHKGLNKNFIQHGISGSRAK